MKSLYWNTVSTLLAESLSFFMNDKTFDDFRLVGGTALSLQLGHRMSLDIDLFTDKPYGSIDFELIDEKIRSDFRYVSQPIQVAIGGGRSYMVGDSPGTSIKLDMYYTDPFLEDVVLREGVRLASINEIATMKVDVVQRTGRKKDFWDIHKLLETQSLADLIGLHARKYPFHHDKGLILNNMLDFSRADSEPDPQCLDGKYWELIKLDLYELIHENPMGF